MFVYSIEALTVARRHHARPRRVLLAGAATALVAVLALVVVRDIVDRSDDPQGAHVSRFVIESAAVGRQEHVTVVVPAGPQPKRPRPLLVFLHGRGGDDRDNLVTPMFTALRRLGRTAPIVAFPDGGTDSYWHDRADGAWGRYVTAEVVPQVVRRFDADGRRVAIGGISMGGYGALDIVVQHPNSFCAVGAHSPALWQTGGETAAGAFDDAEDFAAHDVIATARARPAAFAAHPLRIDTGASDPFLPGDRAFVTALRAAGMNIRLHTAPGGHDDTYWNDHWRAYLRFYAAALRSC